MSTPLAFMASYWLRTLSRVGSSTHSSRRRTVNGSMTRPYSEGLKAPSSRSAMFQIKGARVCWFTQYSFHEEGAMREFKELAGKYRGGIHALRHRPLSRMLGAA
ncbi:hypothetical protein D9M69_633070 [compost metagenome]